ncbi:MAG: hypothetical protein CMF22_11245 [Idiomarinaceae bacterium]|nr:hypothetical protein [Idiomarinaceae bacterium]|tara:strand:- start:138951 stop:139466 length:516 start_codon:yes stop_codon:yes gene_type:complete
MATITTTVSQEYLAAYDGYDSQEVGLGLINPNIYKSGEAYRRKKIKRLAIGLISSVTYAGSEHDSNPKIIPLMYEQAYGTILAYNLNYVPQRTRQAIMKYILDSNAARIRSNQSMIVDYHALKRAVPDSQYIVRRYKAVGINLIETYGLSDVPNVIKGSGRWDNHYRILKG